MIEDYEKRLKELEEQKDSQFEAMRSKLQAEIDALNEQLRKER
jgi:hypothetical protein